MNTPQREDYGAIHTIQTLKELVNMDYPDTGSGRYAILKLEEICNILKNPSHTNYIRVMDFLTSLDVEMVKK